MKLAQRLNLLWKCMLQFSRVTRVGAYKDAWGAMGNETILRRSNETIQSFSRRIESMGVLL